MNSKFQIPKCQVDKFWVSISEPELTDLNFLGNPNAHPLLARQHTDLTHDHNKQQPDMNDELDDQCDTSPHDQNNYVT